MKRIAIWAGIFALLGTVGYAIATDSWVQKQMSWWQGLFGPTVSRTNTPVSRSTAPADAVANGVCRGAIAVAMFDPSYGITQDDVDAYTERYTTEARSCDAIHYLGSVANADGSTDEIYTMTIAGKNLWYVFSVLDGLIVNIQ